MCQRVACLPTSVSDDEEEEEEEEEEKEEIYSYSEDVVTAPTTPFGGRQSLSVDFVTRVAREWNLSVDFVHKEQCGFY